MRLETDWNLTDRLVELPPGARIGDARCELSLHRPNMAGEDATALARHSVLKQAGSTTLCPQTLRFRDHTIRESQFPHRRRAQSHLVDRPANRETGRAFVDEKRGQTPHAFLRVSGGKHNDHVRHGRVGNKGLVAI